MPLAEFIDETMHVVGTDAEKKLVERAKSLRNNTPGGAASANDLAMLWPAVQLRP
jgi:uncharacterized oxidoreductase